jgi:hypothetical protein
MGRVSRYKRIKPSDPFYRGPRQSDSNKGKNLPPKGSTDQPLSRSFREFVESMQEAPTKKEKKTKETTLSKAVESNIKTNRKKKDETDENEKPDEEVLMYKRAKGESLDHYVMRVEYEANKQILMAQMKATKTSTKRKEQLKKRKMKLKLKKKGIKLEDVEGLEFEDLKGFSIRHSFRMMTYV